LALLVLILLILVFVMASRGGSSRNEPAKASSRTEAVPPPSIKETAPESALQLLALLQQESRLVDFLREDLKGFSDADVGAAARVVHEGGRRVLDQYFSLASIRDEIEESRITLAAGFNPAEIRLTGNVVGQPPFTGTLVHRGWKVVDIRLPKLATAHDVRIITPAEVEL
jgi:hypothetical protein